MVTAKKQKQKTVPWLPSSLRERRVSQRRHQPTPTQYIKIKGVGGVVLVVVHGRLSHPRNAGTERVGFLPTRQALFAPSAERRVAFGESHEG